MTFFQHNYFGTIFIVNHCHCINGDQGIGTDHKG